MKLSEFDYSLPPDRIAQEPSRRRDESRLMGAAGGRNGWRHLRFRDLPDLLAPGDLLVLNDTKVLPARLYGRRKSGGKVEMILLENTGGEGEKQDWSCMLKSGRTPPTGETLELDGGIRAELLDGVGKFRKVRLTCAGGSLEDALAEEGRMPLPPYIRRHPSDRDHRNRDQERYQTVFARREGAVAAPTAGLHFTYELLKTVREAGIRVATLTLHVGVGTFLPVEEEDLDRHTMHEERYHLPLETVEAVEETRAGGGRVVAVGTTVVRTLESCVGSSGALEPGEGRCRLFIRPGFRFRVVDAMVTNFHLPRSTLIMLVCAFAGRERILRAYREAIRLDYRFYSYGDAMFLTP